MILRQDLVTTSSSPWIRKDRCLFLFNDILLITTVSRRGAKVLAKLYFVEKFLRMNKHVHRRSRGACRRCRAVCRRCWRCAGTSLCICSFLSDDIFAFRLWMYLTLSDVDICKAKEEGLKKLLKEYRFSKDVYRYL